MTDRELDALVAEKVFGATPCDDPRTQCEAAHMTPVQCWIMPNEPYGSELRDYTGRIEEAWTVVAKMRERGAGFTLLCWTAATMGWCGGDPIACHFTTADGITHYGRAEGDSAPRAICLAALRAVGVKL